MFREVALEQGFFTRNQLPDIPKAKVSKDQSFRRSAFSAEEWIQLEKTACLYWTEGQTGFPRKVNRLGSTRSPGVQTRERRATDRSPGTPSSGLTKGKAPGSRTGHSSSRTTARCSTWQCGSPWSQGSGLIPMEDALESYLRQQDALRAGPEGLVPDRSATRKHQNWSLLRTVSTSG